MTLSVGVVQLKNKNDSICTLTAEDMKRQDDINVYGQTSGSKYVCTVCTVETEECRCVDSEGSEHIGRQAANQNVEIYECQAKSKPKSRKVVSKTNFKIHTVSNGKFMLEREEGSLTPCSRRKK